MNWKQRETEGGEQEGRVKIREGVHEGDLHRPGELQGSGHGV